MKHCAVFVWDIDPCTGERVLRRQLTLEEGRREPLGQDGLNTDTARRDREAFDNEGNGNDHYPIAPPEGLSQQEFDDSVIEQGDIYEQGPYSPFGPNSNTAADNIIENAGGTVPDVWNALGQNAGETPLPVIPPY